MITGILFWLAKPLAELLLVLVVVALASLASLPRAFRQARCKHEGGVNETGSCDAICRQCGKNLGFIGAWRTQKQGAQK